MALGFDKAFPRPNQLCHCIVSKYQLHSMSLHLVLLKNNITASLFDPYFSTSGQDLKAGRWLFFHETDHFSVPNDGNRIPIDSECILYYSRQNLVPKNSRKNNFRFRGFDRKSKSTPGISVQSSRRSILTHKNPHATTM